MPKRINRRDWIKSSSLIALAPSIPSFLRRSLYAADMDTNGRILVVIQLDGGNDGINTVVPYGDEGYAKHRRELRLPTDRLNKIDNQIGLHPAMKSMADLFEDGRLAIVQGVGYPNPNRSHDVSMAIWQTARLDPADHTSFGWIGRAMDDRITGVGSSPSMMLAGDQSPPMAIRGRKSAFTVMNQLTDLERTSSTGEPAALGNTPVDPAVDELTSFIQRTTLDAYATGDRLAEIAGKKQRSAADYPKNELARRLEMIAQLIKADFGTTVYYAARSGYDTHSVQLQSHSRLLSELSGSMKAFLDDLKAASLDDRVIVLCFSEFGRRVAENASQGTDHGTAGPVFVAGAKVKSGLYGTTPSLIDIQDDDLKTSLDFRQVYATLLERWLNVRPEPVLGGSFEPLTFL